MNLTKKQKDALIGSLNDLQTLLRDRFFSDEDACLIVHYDHIEVVGSGSEILEGDADAEKAIETLAEN